MSQLPIGDFSSSFRSLDKTQHALIALATLFLILFIISISIFPLKNSFLDKLYPKTQSFASQIVYSCTPCRADIDRNMIVGPGDLTTLNLCFEKSSQDTDAVGNSCQFADVNGDGVVSSSDRDCIQSHFREVCQ